MASDTLVSNNQKLPAAPEASLCYDMLAMRSPAGVERHDFGATSPGLNRPKSISSVDAMGDEDLTRPGSPTQRRSCSSRSVTSDADSFDSACPPPVGLFRDFAGPAYKSREELDKVKRLRPWTPQPPAPGYAKPSTARSATPTLARYHGKTSYNASADAAVDLTVRPKHVRGAAQAPRPQSAPGRNTPTVEAKRSNTPAAAPTLQRSPTRASPGFSLSGLFSRRKKEPESALPPLKKITFDSRGQKQVVDLSTPRPPARRTRTLEYPASDTEGRARQTLRQQKSAPLSTRSAGPGSRNALARFREPGMPRRTAWK